MSSASISHIPWRPCFWWNKLVVAFGQLCEKKASEYDQEFMAITHYRPTQGNVRRTCLSVFVTKCGPNQPAQLLRLARITKAMVILGRLVCAFVIRKSPEDRVSPAIFFFNHWRRLPMCVINIVTFKEVT